MPGKYSEYYTAPWNDIATVSMRWTSSSDKQMVLDTYYGLGEPVVQDDVEYITADYLINNIDMAFRSQLIIRGTGRTLMSVIHGMPSATVQAGIFPL
jgi:hypothetical protein